MHAFLIAGPPPNAGVLVFMSFLVGILVGLTSMGGAALMTPFLILIVGVRPVLAVGTDLAYGALTKVAGAWMHWRQGKVHMETVRRLAYGSVPGGIAGVLVISRIRRYIDVDHYVKTSIGIVLVVVSLVLLIRTLTPDWIPERPLDWIRAHARQLTSVWGLFVGFTVGMTSVGSGSLIAPFLIALHPGKPALVVGTDVFHAAVLVAATAFLYTGTGQVEWQLVPVLLLGSLPGVLLGSYLAPRLPARILRVGLGIVLLGTGVRLGW